MNVNELMAKLDMTEEDFDLLVDEIAESVIEANKSSFVDVINLDGSLNREIFIGNIYDGLGKTIDGYVRYWNNYDEKHNIAIEDRKPIKLYIDSLGGSLTDTFTIIDAINMSKTPVWTICTGCAYSGGFFAFITGHKRIAYPHASFMMHEGSTSTGGDSHKFRNYAEFYEKEMNQLKEHVIGYTSLTSEEYEKIKRDDWWLTAQEAVEKGVADMVSKELI